MKVLMTVDAVGGVWTYALELTAALAQYDVEVVLACMGPPPCAEQQRRAKTLANLSLYCGDYKLEWMEQPWDDVERAGEWLQELCVQQAPDVLHLNGYAHAASSWPCPTLVVAHSCVVSWWRAVHRCEPPPEWETYRAKVAQGLQAASAVVAPTQSFLDEVQALYSSSAPGSVIYNGRRVQPRRYQSERVPLIFAAGRLWDPGKNLPLLERVAGGLKWRIVVAGSTRNVDGRSAAPRFLECLGHLSPVEMAGWLRRASLFVHPALYEPFGLAVLEAAAAGCALVLSDIPSLRELWDDAAMFVDARDAEGVRAALTTLIESPHRRAELAQRAEQRAKDFSSARMAESYAALYGRLHAAHGAGVARSAAA